METLQEQREKLIVSLDVAAKHLAVCAFTFDGSGNGNGQTSRIIDWSLLVLVGEKEKIPPIATLAFRLYDLLDQLRHRLHTMGFGYVDVVLIENQPARLSGAMKAIQMLVYGYFQMRNYLDRGFGQVTLWAPVNKLKEHSKVIDVTEVIGKKNKRAHYIVNKKKSVAYMLKYIECCPVLTQMMSTRKQDDYADALIQGLAWIRKQGVMIEHCYAAQVPGSVADVTQITSAIDEMHMDA